MFKSIKKETMRSLFMVGTLMTLAEASVPNMPGNYLGVTPIDKTSVRVSFLDNSNNEMGFRVFGEGINVSVPTNDETVSSYAYATITNLTCNKAYTIEAIAHNTEGNSTTSDKRSFNMHSTFGIECDEVPSNDILNAPGSYIGVTLINKSSVRVNFLDNSDNEIGFRVFGNGINELIPPNMESASTETYHNIENLICDKTYQIQAVSYNSHGDSLPSEKRSFNIHTTFALDCDEGNNSLPIAKAGVDQTVVEGVTVQLNGIGSNDSDGDPLTYVWSFVSKPIGSMAILADVTLVNPTFVADVNGTYILGLIVNDGHVDSAKDIMNVIVQKEGIVPPLQAPIAKAGDDVTITEGVLVEFNASSSYDTDGTILSYEWRENGVLLSNSVQFSLNNLAVGLHDINLTVMDDDGLMGMDMIRIIVKKLTNQGVSFHTAFMTNYFDNAPVPSFFISAIEDTDGNITLSDTNEIISFSILAGDIKEIVIPKRMFLSGTNKANKVIRITAQKDIVVVGLNKRSVSTDAYLVLPDKVLANEYYTMSYVGRAVGKEEFAIVAVEDNTVVNVHLANNLGDLNITLEKGEVYQYQNRNELTGTYIKSNKKVAVLSGNVCTDIPRNKSYCDHIVEQVLPLNTWEKEFITVALKTRKNGDTFRILASEDNTEIKINGVVVSILNKGKYYETILENSNYITANQPISVAQYSNSTTYDNVTSDPFMALVPALNQFDTKHIINTLNGFTNYVNIVVPTTGINDVELDGLDISSSEFSAVIGTSYSSAQIQISTGKHTFISNEKMGILGYGYASFDSYGYPSSLRLIKH